jgi:glutaconate CoA-transferase, subunit A
MDGETRAEVERKMTDKVSTLSDAISRYVHDGSSVCLGSQMEQMIPFSAGHEIIRQNRRGLTLIGPISDILFDQLIGAGCVSEVIAAWVGNVMMGSAYNFRREVESGRVAAINLTNFAVSLALQAAAMGVPFLPTLTALGSDVAKDNRFFQQIDDPFGSGTKLHAVKALAPDVTIVHVQRADRDGNAHCWGNFGVMIEAVRAARNVIVVAEEIVEPEIISSDPNRTVIPGFLVSALAESPMGAHPSPVQGCYKRDDAFFRQYHEQSKTPEDFAKWADRWIHSRTDRADYVQLLGECRVESLGVKNHAYAASTDFGY